MTTITPTPLFMRDCLVQLGTDAYEKAVVSVTLTPSTSTVTVRAVSPNAIYQTADEATWVMALTFLQDWDDAAGLSRYLYDNEGSDVTLTFEPITGGATITATVSVTPGAIGGNVGSYAESTVSLPCTGKPSIGA